MSKSPMDRCHDGPMEDIDLLPSYRGDLISLLIRTVYSASSSGDVATRLFRQKPGMQLFFFRKTSSSALKSLKRPRLFFDKKPGIQLFFFRKKSSSARKTPRPTRLCIIDIACSTLLLQTIRRASSHRVRVTGKPPGTLSMSASA